MNVSTRAYYARVNNPDKQKIEREENRLKHKIKTLFYENKQVYGSRRMSDKLSKLGIKAGRYKVTRLISELGLKVRYPKKFKITTDNDHNGSISPNTLDRQFTVTSPNKVWTTDITYIWALEGWIYLGVVIDLFSRQVVGWTINDTMRTSLCVNALQMAFWRRKPRPGQLHHSDRGSQYASKEYRRHLTVMKIDQSMSSKGNYWDNNPTERFFVALRASN